MSKPKNTEIDKPLEAGVDYYTENGYWIFTEKYLLERGHCCGSGCRHCPYRKKSEPDNTPSGK